MFKLGLKFGLVTLCFSCLCLYYLVTRSIDFRQLSLAPQTNATAASVVLVGKVSAVFGDRAANYIPALLTHKQHADRYGYPTHILQRSVVDGYWNKCLYILQILTEELGKTLAERVEWLMYDTISYCIIF
jgi:hypothetical protein